MSSRAVASSSMTRTRSAVDERRPSKPVELLTRGSALAGRRTVKTEPLLGSLATVTSPHHASELAGNGEARPSSAVLPNGGRIGLRELLEQLGLRSRGHANAGVGHYCQLDTRPNPSGWRS